MEILIAIVVILAIVALAAVFAPVTVEFASDMDAPVDEEVVKRGCRSHSHSFWKFSWPGWLPRAERVTHIWRCTSEACPFPGCGGRCTQVWHLG
jgi:hypothetical protein